MNIDLISIKKQFETSILNLQKEINKYLAEKQLQGRTVVNAWSNQNLVVGSLSYFRTANPAEDTIDFVFEISKNLNTFKSDISTSSGELIYQIEDQAFIPRTDEESIAQILELTNKSCKDFIDWFKGQKWQ